MSVEEKYKNRYIIKPFCKFIWGTNNLPDLEKNADEGFYRRINIIPFEKTISRAEELAFDKEKILTPEAINYFANIALREYLKIVDTRKLANYEENKELIIKYRTANDNIEMFLEDEEALKDVFSYDNRVKKTLMYGKYCGWCNKNHFFIRKKTEFYAEVLRRDGYMECKVDGGYDGIKNTNIDSKGLKEKPITF